MAAAAVMTLEVAVKKKIRARINSDYLHNCSDTEATAATDFCKFFGDKNSATRNLS